MKRFTIPAIIARISLLALFVSCVVGIMLPLGNPTAGSDLNATAYASATFEPSMLNTVINFASLIVSVVGLLYLYLKDRHWQEKYHGVVVSRDAL